MQSLINLQDITHLDRHPVEKSNELHVEWFIGKRCNYDCSYCHDLNHDNHSPHTDMTHIVNSIGKMFERFQNKLQINFTGGEPTVHPEFGRLVDFLAECDINVSMTTNGTRKAEYYTDIYRAFNHITYSQHFEHAINDIFLPKMKYINEHRGDRSMQIQVMYHAQHETAVHEAIRYYEFHNIPYTVRRLRPTKNHKYPIQEAMHYSPEQIDTIKWFQASDTGHVPNVRVTAGDQTHTVHTNELTGLGMRSFRGWMCLAGVNFIRVHDNLVYRCWGEFRTPIGDITDPDFQLLTEAKPCIANKCVCAPEISTRKWRV